MIYFYSTQIIHDNSRPDHKPSRQINKPAAITAKSKKQTKPTIIVA